MGQCSVSPAIVVLWRCCWLFPVLLFYRWDLKFIPPKTPKLSCHAFVLCCDPFYWLPRFYRRQAGSKSSHSVKCSSALVLDSAALPVSCAASRALGRFQHRPRSDWWGCDPVSKCVPVVVSAWWRWDKEGATLQVHQRVTAEVLSFCFFPPMLSVKSGRKKMRSKSIKVTVSLFAFLPHCITFCVGCVGFFVFLILFSGRAQPSSDTCDHKCHLARMLRRWKWCPAAAAWTQ